MTSSSVDVHYILFYVIDKPYCLWGNNVETDEVNFLTSLDPGYFVHVAQKSIAIVEDLKQSQKDRHYAAMTLRSVYSQSLETMFALLTAALQAPRCVYAWMSKYRTPDLRDMLSGFNSGSAFSSIIALPTVDWRAVADYVYASFAPADKEFAEATVQGFAQAWKYLAIRFLDEAQWDEYNSIKHGLRISPGGFGFAYAIGEFPDSPVPADKMNLVGESEFGSSHYSIHKVQGLNLHLFSKLNHHNWSPTELFASVELIACSIHNVIAMLLKTHEAVTGEISYMVPADKAAFDEPGRQRLSLGVTNLQMGGFELSLDRPMSRPEIEVEIQLKRTSGVMQFQRDSGGK